MSKYGSLDGNDKICTSRSCETDKLRFWPQEIWPYPYPSTKNHRKFTNWLLLMSCISACWKKIDEHEWDCLKKSQSSILHSWLEVNCWRSFSPHPTPLVSEINPDSPLPSLSQPHNPLHPDPEPWALIVMNLIWRTTTRILICWSILILLDYVICHMITSAY